MPPPNSLSDRTSIVLRDGLDLKNTELRPRSGFSQAGTPHVGKRPYSGTLGNTVIKMLEN